MKKLTSLLTNLKSVITNINFLYTINFLVFAALSVLSTIKLNYGILAMIVLLWTLFVIYIIITLVIYYIHSNDYDDAIGKTCTFLLVIVSIFIYPIFGLGSLVDQEKAIKTEIYSPENVIRTDTRIILIGKTQTLESIFISDLSKINPKICKDEYLNSWNNRTADKWYICGK